MNNLKLWILICLVLTFLPAGNVAYAQTGSGYDLSWHTTDGGGDTLTGSGYSLSGTVGQPDAATQTLSSSGYSLTGGFWPVAAGGGSSGGQSVYLPIVLKNT